MKCKCPWIDGSALVETVSPFGHWYMHGRGTVPPFGHWYATVVLLAQWCVLRQPWTLGGSTIVDSFWQDTP